MRTFVDAGILMLAARGTDVLSERALAVLSEPGRIFVASPFLRLEVLPKPTYFRRGDEVAFYEAFFASVASWVPASGELVDKALQLAAMHGLSCVDALHAAAAIAGSADEFVTAERPTSPLSRVIGVVVRSILDGKIVDEPR